MRVRAFEKSCLTAVWICVMAVTPGMAQVRGPVHETNSSTRLLSLEEGRAIVNVVWQQEQMEAGMRDCSHFVHQVYVEAGFEYPYASSFEIYAGHENFVRVKYPHPGDLIVWPGHVGIVVDPLEHSFYSLVRTGLEAQDYQSAYWRSRGRARFYRYRVERGTIINAANTAGPGRIPSSHKQYGPATAAEERTAADYGASDRPPASVSEKTDVIYGPPGPDALPEAKDEETAFAIPASVIISTGSKPPTREEVEEGVSELSDAYGSALRNGDPMNTTMPTVIVEQFRVERVDVKRDRGWARLAVDSKVTIGSGTAQMKRRHDKVRWELRRTESGWEALPPQDRNYVPHDVAVKNLAEQLAQLTKSDGAAQHQPAVLRQESRLAGLLNALLENR